MHIRGKKTFHQLFQLVRAIEADQADLSSVRQLNVLVLKQVLHSERAILRHRNRQRDLNGQLKTGRGTKEESRAIRAHLARVRRYIAAQEDQIFIWKCFGDALAYIYLDKFSIKHAFFETDRRGIKDQVGMLSGKVGLANELGLLLDAIEHGVPAVLCDITNTLRYGDICLLGGSDPFLVEVKSSPKTNKRGKRQMAKLAKLHSFLNTDEAVDFRGGKGLTRRVSLSIPEADHVAELNRCIARAKRDAQCIVQPEPGVTYVAMYNNRDFEPIGKAIEGTAPTIFMLNGDKNDHAWPPYTPFLLSIREEEHLLDFIEGRLFLIVMIDAQVLCGMMADDEWAVRYRGDADYAIQCMHRPTRAYIGVSGQFFARAAYEFVSLKWIADQHRPDIRQVEEIADTFGESPDPRAHEQNLLRLFGPDDEWTRDLVA
jgi:hypothetical protein